MKERISILLPTRKRPTNVVRIWDSVLSTVVDKTTIEFVFAIDDDDAETVKTVESLTGLSKVVSVGPHKKCLPWDRLGAATGDILMLCGDDIIFRTPGWDDKVRESFAQWPDRIGLVYGNDGFWDDRLCTHPFVHRRWVEVVGYIAPPCLNRYYIDNWLFDIARYAGRCCHRPDVYTEHAHYGLGKATMDETYKLGDSFMATDGQTYRERDGERREVADKLKRMIS
jgi:glycosyltransferase involved in cell wall biosynthesis